MLKTRRAANARWVTPIDDDVEEPIRARGSIPADNPLKAWRSLSNLDRWRSAIKALSPTATVSKLNAVASSVSPLGMPIHIESLRVNRSLVD